MSYAWQVSDADVYHVLRAHGAASSMDDDIVLRSLDTVHAQEGRVEKAALCYDDMDDQTDSSYVAIEAILIEEAIIHGPAKFEAK
jgi:hypothetical protein